MPRIESIKVPTQTFGEVKLKRFNFDDSSFALKLLSETKDGREYTIRVLHHQLIAPQLSSEDFERIPNDELRDLARAFIANEPSMFRAFKETNDEELYVNFREAIDQGIKEIGKKFVELAIPALPDISTIQNLADTLAKVRLRTLQSVQHAIEHIQSADFQESILGQFLESVNKLLFTQQPQLAGITPILSSLNKDQLNALAELSTNLSSKLRSREFYDELHSVSSRLASIPAAQQQTTFGQQVTDKINEAFKSAKDNPRAFDQVEQLVQDRIQTLPKDRISLEGIALIVAVLSLLAGMLEAGVGLLQYLNSRAPSDIQNRSLRAEENQSESLTRLLEFVEKIASNTQQLIPTEDPSTYYVIERPVDVRSKPTAKSASLGKLYPNQKVRLVQRKHEWIYVEYFDYIEGVPKYAWLLKKYSKMLND
jgi:hypothetical protein